MIALIHRWWMWHPTVRGARYPISPFTARYPQYLSTVITLISNHTPLYNNTDVYLSTPISTHSPTLATVTEVVYTARYATVCDVVGCCGVLVNHQMSMCVLCKETMDTHCPLDVECDVLGPVHAVWGDCGRGWVLGVCTPPQQADCWGLSLSRWRWCLCVSLCVRLAATQQATSALRPRSPGHVLTPLSHCSCLPLASITLSPYTADCLTPTRSNPDGHLHTMNTWSTCQYLWPCLVSRLRCLCPCVCLAGLIAAMYIYNSCTYVCTHVCDVGYSW